MVMAEKGLGQRKVSRETYQIWAKKLRDFDTALKDDKDLNALLVKQFKMLQIPGGDYVKASQKFYDKLFEALKKDGKVTIQYVLIKEPMLHQLKLYLNNLKNKILEYWLKKMLFK